MVFPARQVGYLTADMGDSAKTSGHCLCGAVRFKYDPGAVRWTGHCYCKSCRRATASPVTTFVGVADSGFRWLGETPSRFASSPGVTRSFCPTCGTQMAFQSTRWPGEIHFYAVTLIDPSDIKPEAIFHAGERLPWIDLKEKLPHR